MQVTVTNWSMFPQGKLQPSTTRIAQCHLGRRSLSLVNVFVCLDYDEDAILMLFMLIEKEYRDSPRTKNEPAAASRGCTGGSGAPRVRPPLHRRRGGGAG